MNELEKLYSHSDDITIAMMTTHRSDGHLQSRAIATEKRAGGADLWIVTTDHTRKLRDVAADPHVNLSCYKDRTRGVSVAGLATISRDRGRIHEFSAADWKARVAEQGDSVRGGRAGVGATSHNEVWTKPLRGKVLRDQLSVVRPHG
jgi:general stress protein 26